MREKIIVEKFGGTSVATSEKIKKIALYVKKQLSGGKIKSIIVVSAMGKETDELQQLAWEVCEKSIPTPREFDLLMTSGERKTSPLMALALNSIGVKAISVNSLQIGVETNEKYGNAKILSIKNIGKIKKLFKEYPVIVVPGFQGIIKGTDEVVALGRGGSDKTAIALASSLGNKYCKIHTDVDGVYAVDPRIVPGAKKFKEVGYDQMIRLSSAGAGVLMDQAVKTAADKDVTIEVRLSPSLGESDGGTLVGRMRHPPIETIWGQAGLAIQQRVMLVKIHFPSACTSGEMLASIKEINIIDADIREQNKVSLFCSPTDLNYVLADLEKLKQPEIKTEIREVAGLTLVDSMMKEQPGYVYRVIKSLEQAQIKYESVTSSGTSILIVVRKDECVRTAEALAREFSLIES